MWLCHSKNGAGLRSIRGTCHAARPAERSRNRSPCMTRPSSFTAHGAYTFDGGAVRSLAVVGVRRTDGRSLLRLSVPACNGARPRRHNIQGTVHEGVRRRGGVDGSFMCKRHSQTSSRRNPTAYQFRPLPSRCSSALGCDPGRGRGAASPAFVGTSSVADPITPSEQSGGQSDRPRSCAFRPEQVRRDCPVMLAAGERQVSARRAYRG